MINPLAYKKKRIYSQGSGIKSGQRSSLAGDASATARGAATSYSSRANQPNTTDFRYESFSEGQGGVPVRVLPTSYSRSSNNRYQAHEKHVADLRNLNDSLFRNCLLSISTARCKLKETLDLAHRQVYRGFFPVFVSMFSIY